MADNANAEEVPRTDYPNPKRESSTTRNMTVWWNFRNYHSKNRKIRVFAGKKKYIEAVLTLVSEQVNKGVTFERFQETLKNYVSKNLENGEDIVTLVMKLKDHTPTF